MFIISKLVKLIHLAVVMLLLISNAVTFVNPAVFWPISFLGLIFPWLFLANVLFVVYYLFRFNYRIIYSIIVLLVSWGNFQHTFAFNRPISNSYTADLKVATYNAGIFGYFQNKWYSDKLMQHLKFYKYDFVCIQEFLNKKTEQGTTLDSILKLNNFNYFHFEKLEDGRKSGEYGLLFLSKHKILESGMVHFDQLTGNMCVYTDIEVNEKRYRIFNVHLQSFRLSKKELKILNDKQAHTMNLPESKGLIHKMRNAYTKRAQQVEIIKTKINSTTVPYFILGDFNEPPVSYSYGVFSKNMKDAFVENGIGLGKTYLSMIPHLRIDYILYPKSFKGMSYKTFELGSDHKLVQTELSLLD